MGGLARLIAPIAASIVGCALFAWPQSGGAASTPTQRTAQDNQAAATSDAKALLGLAPLPAGATVASADPSGGGLAVPAQSIATPNLVDLTRWWLVPRAPDATFSFIKSHPPKNSKPSAIGFYSLQPNVTVRFVGFQWPPRQGVTDSRILAVEETAAPNGQTAVRADAEVVWVSPRPASERIPSDARVLTVSVQRPHKPPVSVTVSKASIVHRLAAVIDSLETVQPARVTSCANQRFNLPKISFSFSATRTGPPLAVARETYSPKAPGTFPCDPMSFTINGKPQTSLLDPTGSTIRTARDLLGKLP